MYWLWIIFEEKRIQCYKGVQDQHKEEFLTRVVCLAGITQCIIGGDYWRKDDVMTLSCAEKRNMTNGCFYKEDGSFDYCMCTGNLCNGYCSCNSVCIRGDKVTPCNSSSTIDINLMLVLSCLTIVYFKLAI